MVLSKKNSVKQVVKNRVEMNRNETKKEIVKPVVQETGNTSVRAIVGYLDIMPDSHGFVRPYFVPNGKDAYIPSSQIRRLSLR